MNKINRVVILIVLLCASYSSFAQTLYKGKLDKFPLTMIIEPDQGDGSISAVYCYNKYHEPIVLEGTLYSETLTFKEYSSPQHEHIGTFIIYNYDAKAASLSGTWQLQSNKSSLPLTLQRQYSIEDGTPDASFMLPISMGANYLKIITSLDTESQRTMITGLQIIDKRSDKIIQTISDMHCQFRTLGNISSGDFNFDGYPDISVFEEAFAGPNTTSAYFLYNPSSRQYERCKDLDGKISLTFDKDSHEITETNSCCAGSQITQAVYKFDSNGHLKTIAEHEYKIDQNGEQKEVKKK